MITYTIAYLSYVITQEEHRLRIEKALISLLDNSEDFYPDDNWLGKFSPVNNIRRSGLWLTQGLDAEPLMVEELGQIKDSVRFVKISEVDARVDSGKSSAICVNKHNLL
ncbi:MAG: hypothetical protein PHZ11_09935 [Desulfitobacteriaceae bacterium]|nr:hypothetical protein [Desulfitobacteriaceae bacterium]